MKHDWEIIGINELEELAKAGQIWSSCYKAWLDNSEDVSTAVVGHISEDGETYPVITVDCDQYYSGDFLNLAKFYAAANPSAISELIAAYREAVAALDINTELFDQYDSCHKLSITEPARKRARDALDTAKRLGVESK